jgi:hypothetical protein
MKTTNIDLTSTFHFDSIAEGDVVHDMADNKFYRIKYINSLTTFTLIPFNFFLNTWYKFKYWFKKIIYKLRK